MSARRFRAMGTRWWVHCDRPELLDEAERVVHDAEGELSRFLPGSALSALNRERRSASPLLLEVLRLAVRMRTLTGGAFDPTLGACLVALGYDRPFEEIVAGTPLPSCRAPRPRLIFEEAEVRLEGPGLVDLGGVAKGFTVDRVVGRLRSLGAQEVLVDGGGDIRGAGGSWPIGVGDGLVVDSCTGAIATSSIRRRRWPDATGADVHHLLDPRSDRPAAGPLDEVTVGAARCAYADGLATALLVDPPAVLRVLRALDGWAAVRSRDGSWWTTPGAPLRSAAADRRSAPLRHPGALSS